MSALAPLTLRLRAAQDLPDDQIAIAADALADEAEDAQAKAEFLVAWSDKGETAAEIAALARAFRAKAIDPGVQRFAAEAIDIVGTGGDHSGGFNISSLVVLTLAAAGVKVMKHGNRGITSACGSADLLAALGVKLDAPAAQQKLALDQLGYCFFFAPAYHPAFKHIAPVRKALAAQGRRTVFNILGPTINPGRPAHILLGVFAPAWVERMAEVLDRLETTAGLVAHGVIAEDRGIDEATTATRNLVRGVGRLREVAAEWTAESLGLPRCDFSDLQGGDVAHNVSLVEAILDGRGPAGLVDTVTLNAAMGLWITGRVASARDGLAAARECLLGGGVRLKIAATREFFGA